MLERRTWLTLALLLLPVALLVLGAEQFGVRLLERIAINLCISLTLVVGLQVFMGNSGILSFAHIGFMGVGAYAAAVLSIPARMKGMACRTCTRSSPASSCRRISRSRSAAWSRPGSPRSCPIP